jgi:putative oxidoreductase
MKYIVTIVRVLLGLAFVIFGSNIFLHFIPMPPPPPGDAGVFAGILMHSGYMNVVGALQVLGGICLLTGRLAPLGLTLLGPVVVNIILFHFFSIEAVCRWRASLPSSRSFYSGLIGTNSQRSSGRKCDCYSQLEISAHVSSTPICHTFIISSSLR